MKKLVAILFCISAVSFGQNRRALAQRAPQSAAAATPAQVEQASAGDRSFTKFQVSLELLGAGFWYQVFASYRPIKTVAFNLGFSYLPLSLGGMGTSASITYLSVPVSASFLLGGEENFLEILAGFDVLSVSAGSTTGGTAAAGSIVAPIPQIGIGYRLWPTNSGFHFRVTAYANFLPGTTTGNAIWTSPTGMIMPYVGLSFGQAF